jgi:hypothetical protein
MACSSCGKPRMQMSRNAGAAPRLNTTQNSTVRTVDSQSVAKVQGAVVSNPNAPKRTKV